MRKYIIVALVLLAGGIAASLYFIPTSQEAGGMQAAGAALQQNVAGLDLEAEYAKNNRSLAIISALADKRAAEGKRPEAVKLLEEYVAANPNDLNGHKRLAKEYLAASNNEGYYKELEFLAKAEPTEENLLALSALYNSSKDYTKQVGVLTQLVDVSKGAKPQYFVDLATMQVVVGDQEGALKTVQNLKAKHPTFSSYPMTRIMVSVLAGKGEVDQAFAAAKEWMDKVGAAVPAPNAAPVVAAAPAAPAPVGVGLNQNAGPAVGKAVAAAAGASDSHPQELADLSDILLYSGHADKAVALVDLYPAMLEHEPKLVLSYVNANIAAGKSDHAYEVLKKIDDAGQMIAALYPPYLDLTLRREDVPAAEAIATKLDAPNFTEAQALNTLEIARANSAPSVMKILTTRFSDPKILVDKPVLDAVIAMLTNDKLQDKKIETALGLELTGTQRLSLADACVRAKKPACFDAIVKLYPTLDKMTPQQVVEYAQLFIIADRANDIVDGVGKLASVEHPDAQVALAYHRLQASAGRAETLKPWLQANAATMPVSQLQDLFYLANVHHHELASDIAERLYARDPSPMNRDIMVAAYMGANRPDKAVPLLREALKEPGTNDGMYLNALSQVARRDAAARKELVDYAQAALTAGKGDDRAQLNYAYILINNGKRVEVMPFARTNAASRGGEWKKMLAQLTNKPKAGGTAVAVKLTREQMVAMAQSKTISAVNKRQIAFNLLHDGYKDDAVVIFKDLAKDKGADSQEVQDLLYMWGGKLSGEQLAWVENRAKNANAYEKQQWATLVGNVADDAGILGYVSATPDALYNRELRKKYFGILARSGSRKNYDVAMHDWVAQTTDVPALLDYATTAQDFGYREAAVNGFTRVLALDANNSKALSHMATLDFSKGKFTAADQKLNQYLSNQQQAPDPETNPAQAHFYKAELLRRKGDKAGAQAEYNQVIQLTTAAGATTPDALSRMYTSEFHLGQHADAKAGFEQLLEQYPDDKGVLADYMSVLIEYKYLDDATRIANQYDKNSPYYRKGAQLVGRSVNTSAIERFSAGREMKISFAKPLDEKSPIDVKAAKKLAWFEQATTGYDSVTISAKPGYVVRYVPTSNEQFAVVAEEMPEVAPSVEAQRQQDLRLQLLYARIERDSGQEAKANERLAALEHYYPNDPQLLSYKASIASADGHRGQATQLIAQAQAAAPENEDLTLQAQNIRAVEKGVNYVKLDHEYRALGDNNEQITTLSGVVNATDNVEFGMNVQNDTMDTDGTRRARDGLIGNYSANRQRGELYAAAKLNRDLRAQASLFANNKTLGGGAYLDVNNALGKTQLIGEYQRPYWDFVEAVYEHTTRDRVGFKHFANLRPTTSLGLEASVNNYNIDLKDDVAQTALIRLNVIQEVQPKTDSQPYLGVGYGFDGEYLMDKPELAANSDYYLLPVRTREIHALTGIYRDDWTKQTHALLIAGAAYDRINGGFSPIAEAHLDQDITANWQVGARARYAQETNNTDNNALNLGADILYKF